MHGIHVGRRTSEVGEVATEVGHLCDGFDFAQNAFLGTGHDKFPLMGGDRAERTAAEATAMHAHGEASHLERRDAFSFVFRVGQPRVGQVEGMVELLGSHGRIGWGDDDPTASCLLEETLSLEAVALFLNLMEVLSVAARLLLALLEGMKDNVVWPDTSWNIRGGLVGCDRLGKAGKGLAKRLGGQLCVALLIISQGWMPAVEHFKRALYQLQRGLFAHTVKDGVGAAV